MLNKSKGYYRNNRERIRNKYKSLSEDEKNYQKEYRKNMSDEQKQKYREAEKHKYHNRTDEQKQKYREAINDRKKDIRKNIEKI